MSGLRLPKGQATLRSACGGYRQQIPQRVLCGLRAADLFGTARYAYPEENRVNHLCGEVNKTLRRIVNLLGYDEEITWYSARGTYITMMVDKKYPPGVVAEHSGNSVITIYKFYWKNQNESDIIAELCEEFRD